MYIDFNKEFLNKKGTLDFKDGESFNTTFPIGIATYDKDLLKKFIDIVHKYNPLDEIMSQILTYLDFSTPEKEVIETVMSHVKNNELQKAIELAIKYQDKYYYEIIWKLAEFLYEPNNCAPDSIDEISAIYKAISPKNAHFANVYDRLLHLLLRN